MGRREFKTKIRRLNHPAIIILIQPAFQRDFVLGLALLAQF